MPPAHPPDPAVTYRKRGLVARRIHQDSLSRVVGIGGLLGTAYGYVGTSIYFVLGAIGLYALGVTPILILVVGLVFILTAWSYAEGSAAMPEARAASRQVVYEEDRRVILAS